MMEYSKIKKCMILFIMLCLQAVIMVVYYTVIMPGPWVLPPEQDSTYYRLSNYTLTRGYYHIQRQDADYQRADCRSLCDRYRACQAYTSRPPPQGSSKGVCHFFNGSPLSLGLRPQQENSGTELFVRNSKHEVVLQEDHNAYYSVTNLTKYTEAVKACNQSFYHLAMAVPGNHALKKVKMYFKNILLYSQDSAHGIGLFIDVYSKIGLGEIPHDPSGLQTYFIVVDDPGHIYVKRIVYYNGTENVIASTSNTLGYPFCQGTPFNLLGESGILNAAPYPVSPPEVPSSTYSIKLQRPQQDL